MDVIYEVEWFVIGVASTGINIDSFYSFSWIPDSLNMTRLVKFAMEGWSDAVLNCNQYISLFVSGVTHA